MPQLQLNTAGYPMLPGIGQECNRRFCHRMFDNGGMCGTRDGINWAQCYECIDAQTTDERRREAERKRTEDAAKEAERLRLEEQQRAQEEAKEAERVRLEEQQRAQEEAKEAERLRLQEQQRLEAEQKRALEERQRLEAARKQQEEARLRLAEQQRLVAARATASHAAEEMHAQMLKDKAKLKEWGETFCFGRLVKLTQKGPQHNRFALVIARPSDDGSLKVRLFKENVRCLLQRFGRSNF